MIPVNNAQKNIDYGYGAETDFYIVMIIPLLVNTFSFSGTLFIFYRTFSRWKHDRKNLSLSVRFPFYIAITDFLYSLSILIEYSYIASNKSEFINSNETVTWPFLLCKIFGLFFTVFVLLNILLVGAMSIVSWLRVVPKYRLELGKYDYKIWFPIILISLIIPLSSVNAYGLRNYSCGTKIGYNTIAIVVLSLIFITLLTIVFCYAQIIITIRNIKEDNGSIPNLQNNLAQLTSIEKRTFKKVLTYILVFILQYIPIMIYNVCMFLKIRNIILDALSPAVISFGGIGNVIQYLYNEGLSNKHTTSNYKLDSNEQSQQLQQSQLQVIQ
ncbi:hypothetical protein GLOIN_2v1783713 [Rhizophagus clarus]|uniref:G-protein coupled receptors family 1 profile domain-containing protein n=1 Tax=Rhizophagus clarus TaxID=94130 RepID=A0A8H3LJE7_9GLOM|nr:hypothetical protein GLOIN_2v1783713 [Rhizophagus clarus]